MQDKNCKGQIPSKIFETLGSRRMWAPRGGFECAVSAQRRGVTSQPALEDRGGDEKSVWRGGSQAVLAVAAWGKFQVGVLGSELSRSHTRGGRGAQPRTRVLSSCCRPRAFIYNRRFLRAAIRDAHSGTARGSRPRLQRGGPGPSGRPRVAAEAAPVGFLPLSRGLAAPTLPPSAHPAASPSGARGLLAQLRLSLLAESSEVCISAPRNPPCRFAFHKSPVAACTPLSPRHSTMREAGLAGAPPTPAWRSRPSLRRVPASLVQS